MIFSLSNTLYRKSSSYSFLSKIYFLLALIIGYFNLIGTFVYGQKNTRELKNSKDYIGIVKHYRYLDPDSALFFVKEGLKKAQQDKDKLGEAALLNQYGMIEDNATRYKESREKYLQAEAIYRKEKNEEGLASTLIRLGVVEKRKGNYDKSLSYFIDALKISEKNKHKLGMLEGRVVFSETYYSLGEYENALKNLDMARAIDKEIPLSSFSLNMYISYGYVYIKMKEYDKAIYYTKIGLGKSNKVEYNGLRVSLLKLLGMAYGKQGDKDKAITAFKQALQFSRKIKNALREQEILIELSNIYVNDAPNTALKYLKQALEIVDKHKMSRQQITILNAMSELYKKKGNLAEALALREQSYELADQVYYKDMMKQISSLEADYDLEKSNAQLRELTLKNSREKMAKNVILSIAIGTFLLLLIILTYYFRSKYLNKLLKKANYQLEESNNVKDKFFSIIAHDIRSPLVSTIGILQLINDDEIDNATRREMVGKLTLHCRSSLEILDKLLKWGQMQIKGVRLNITEFNPKRNINRNIALLRQAAEKKHIALKIEVPDNILIKADGDHFDFVIRNLLANAIKFTEINGLVHLNVEAIDRNMVQFSVIDNGVGISTSRIRQIFELSGTSTNGTSQEQGTSLGLVICKEFIQANHGELKVESEVGVGTKFMFTLKGFQSLSN
jgi:signal transduction histidine kinase